MSTVLSKNLIKGGEFLISNTEAEDIFIAEEWNEEQRMIAQTCSDFVDAEILPNLDKIDSMEYPEMLPSLLDKTGELGLLGASIPEKYGGFGMDFNTSMLIAESIGKSHSFIVAFLAHSGIGTMPILFFGSEELKKKYLPALASGKMKAAYCLTEPDAGSDANAGKSKATLSGDKKHYILNGQKMWITNAGFADVFTVFAKIDDDKYLSAFVVEKEFGGITMNPEEKKMGIKGCSTRQIFFNDCKVPVENLLGERAEGFKIALKILNIGRIDLGAATMGGSKYAIANAIHYANERKQFGVSIGHFGAIQHKLADMATFIYASEAALYRSGHQIEQIAKHFIREGLDDSEAMMKAIEENAIECAIMKIHGSEVLDFIVDESVQIYGGMGYSAEGPVERGYRDARINRIFEGTNEINRLVIMDMLLKRAMKGQIDLLTPALEIQKELTSIPEMDHNGHDTPLAAEKQVILNLKKAGLLVAGAAVKKLMKNLKDEQEILMHLADIMINLFVAESVLLRVEKLATMEGVEACELQTDMARIYLHRAVNNIALSAREVIYAFAEGDEERMLLLGLKRFTKIDPFNLKAARRRVAGFLLERNEYAF